jgi:hypothetical protein
MRNLCRYLCSLREKEQDVEVISCALPSKPTTLKNGINVDVGCRQFAGINIIENRKQLPAKKDYEFI